MEYNNNSMLNITFNSTLESKQFTNVDMTFIITELVLRLIAVVTNILVVATISASIKQWKYSMDTLMLTLALCDTVLNAIVFTNFIVLTLENFNHLFLIVFSYMSKSLETLSKLLMLAFSVNRYALVCKPFTHHRITSRKSTVIQLIILAVIAFTTNIPMLLPSRMNATVFTIYELISIVMTFYIPLIITFVLTVLVICELNRNHGTLGVSSESTETRQGEKNITRTMVITVMAYILLVLPSTIGTGFIQLFYFNLPIPLILTLAILFDINYSVNIFIYTLYLPKFRSTLFGIFKCKCCKKVPDESVRITTEPSTSVQMRQLLS